MGNLFRKKAQVASLVSLALLTQCCCCILPVGWQVSRDTPGAQKAIQQIEEVFSINLDAVETFIVSAK